MRTGSCPLESSFCLQPPVLGGERLVRVRQPSYLFFEPLKLLSSLTLSRAISSDSAFASASACSRIFRSSSLRLPASFPRTHPRRSFSPAPRQAASLCRLPSLSTQDPLLTPCQVKERISHPGARVLYYSPCDPVGKCLVPALHAPSGISADAPCHPDNRCLWRRSPQPFRLSPLLGCRLSRRPAAHQDMGTPEPACEEVRVDRILVEYRRGEKDHRSRQRAFPFMTSAAVPRPLLIDARSPLLDRKITVLLKVSAINQHGDEMRGRELLI